MRTISAALNTAMKNANYTPIWKVVLSRTGQTTRGYDRTRFADLTMTEEDDSQVAGVVLKNHDGALTGLDFENYQMVISTGAALGTSRSAWAANTAYAVNDIRRPTTANGYQYRCSVAGTSHATTEPTWPTSLGVTVTDGTVTWEMDGNAGDDYSRKPPLRVRAQELHSRRGILTVHLQAIGIPNQLGEDKATGEYTQTDADTQTVKTLINAVTGVTLSPYTDYTAVTTTYDSEDSLIDVVTPKDYFSVQYNLSRLEAVKKLLGYTGCKMRAEDDGKLHILDPITTGTTYDHEYKFNVAGDHPFFSKKVRERFVNPNKVVVTGGGYTGSATSATSYALAPKIQTVVARLASTAQGNSIAAAIIERYELEQERGFITVPMNFAQEIWDYVKVTDSMANDTRTGNVQFIRTNIHVPVGGQMVFDMDISFGKPSSQAIASLNMVRQSGGESGQVPSWAYEILDAVSIIESYISTSVVPAIQELERRIYNAVFRHQPTLDAPTKSLSNAATMTKSPTLDAPTKAWS